ncbi:uncharacterized protein LOC144110587 isoform X3 [Amblyomma americanum]
MMETEELLMEHGHSRCSVLPVKVEIIEGASNPCEMLITNEQGTVPLNEEIIEGTSNPCEMLITNEQGGSCIQVGREEEVRSCAHSVSVIHNGNEKGASATQPPQWRSTLGSVRVDPDIIEIGKILTDPARLEGLLVEFGLGVTPPPSVPKPEVDSNSDKRKRGSNAVWGKCSELGFNPVKPECKGRVTTVTRNTKSGFGSLCYRCTTCRKMITQRRGAAPWAQQSTRAPESFFYEVDRAGRPNVKMPKSKILWILYCMAKGLSATATRDLGGRTFSLASGTLVTWRQRVRQAASRSLADHPRLGGSSERVQVGIFKRKAKGAEEEEERLMLGLQAESTGEFRLRCIEKDDPGTIARVISNDVLPETIIVSNGGKPFSHVEVVEDEEGPMRLTHDAGYGRDNAQLSSKRNKAFFNTQRLRVSWRRVLWSLKQSGPLREARAFQLYLDWFWWLSLNGPERCKDPFLRLLESIASAYRV